MFFRDGGITIGPIPKGFPVSLLANADLAGADLAANSPERREHDKRLLRLLQQMQREMSARRDIFASPAIVDGLLSISKCPDLVVNKGHYFGTSLLPEEPALTDSDKRALIGFLKTF
jgi:hypothetical protein